MKKCRAAVAQIRIVRNPRRNIKKVLKYIKKAAKKKADILLFPETCIYVKAKDDPKDFNEYLEQIKSACKTNKIWCIFTSYNLRRKRKYNTGFLVNRQGKVVYKYDKMHLYGNEEKYITPGKSNRVVNTEFGKIGMIICFDLSFPESMRKLAKQGALIIFCPTYEIDWKRCKYIAKALPIVRAYEDIVDLVIADAYARDTVSNSVILSPYHVIKRIFKREGLIVGTLDPAKIKKLRKSKHAL